MPYFPIEDPAPKYTPDTLDYALLRILGSQAYHTLKSADVSTSHILERAARFCFVYMEAESEHTKILRQALFDLDTKGQFNYAPVE